MLKSSNYLGEEWTLDYCKDHTVVTDTYNTQGIFRPASSWQTHHLIPQAVWKENKIFFNSFGMKGKGLGRDSWTNGWVSPTICWMMFIYQLTQTIRLGGNYEEINGVGI